MDRMSSLTATLCLQVCVHRGTVYPVGQFWEEGCDVCTCTDLEDSVMGLRVAQCSQKPCEDNCRSVRGGEDLGTTWSCPGRKLGGGVPRRSKKSPLVTSGSWSEVRGRRELGLGMSERRQEERMAAILL